MPRLFAQNRLSMWADDDFRALSSDAQNLYNYLLAHPTMTYAGVADWFPKRLAHVNVSWDEDFVAAVGDELAWHHFVIIDQDWDQVCVRSFLRHEQVLRSPNLARATARAFEKIASPRLQRVVIHELLRLREEFPDWSAWDLPEYDDLMTSRPPLDGKTIDAPLNSSRKGSDNPPTDPSPKGQRKGSDNPSAKGSDITSNLQPLTSNPEPVTVNLEPPRVAVDDSLDDEITARATMQGWRLDYSEVRKLVMRTCGRNPAPGTIVHIAEAILERADQPVKHPLAYVAEAIRQSWAEWQRMCDEEAA